MRGRNRGNIENIFYETTGRGKNTWGDKIIENEELENK